MRDSIRTLIIEGGNIHEAAHVAMAYRVGWAVEWVSANAYLGGQDHCSYDAPGDRTSRQEAWTSLAGPMAEHKWIGTEWLPIDIDEVEVDEGDRYDVFHSAKIETWVNGGDAKELVAEWEAQVAKELGDPDLWDQIIAIAAAMEGGNLLERDEIETILGVDQT